MITERTKPRVHDEFVADLRQRIQSGELKADHYLLPERELAKKYSVSSRAVREGLARLEAEGLICRQQGRGTVVLRRETRSAPVRHKNVAVIFQGRVRDTSTAEEFDSLQQAFQDEGYGATLYVADGVPEKEAQIVQQLAAEGVPGMVLYSCHPFNSYAYLKHAEEAGTKIVVFDHDFPELDCNFVGIDDELAAFEATEHLIRLGCSELLFINSERPWTTHLLRECGFQKAAAKWGNIPHRIIKLPNRPIEQLGDCLQQEMATKLKSMSPRLGVVAWWDEIALRAIDVLQASGWSVPKDASVVGFANDRSGEIASIPLTTMAIPRKEIARLAAETLVNQMRNPARPAQRIRLNARMIIRESCGTYPRPLRDAGHEIRASATDASMTTPVATRGNHVP
jgi:DNA-binding LacI/PurR family transcriptional regulator